MTARAVAASKGEVAPRCYRHASGADEGELFTGYLRTDASGKPLEWCVVSGVAPADLGIDVEECSGSVIRPVEVRCYEHSLGQFTGYAVSDAEGNFLRWEVLEGTAPSQDPDAQQRVRECPVGIESALANVGCTLDVNGDVDGVVMACKITREDGLTESLELKRILLDGTIEPDYTGPWVPPSEKQQKQTLISSACI